MRERFRRSRDPDAEVEFWLAPTEGCPQATEFGGVLLEKAKDVANGTVVIGAGRIADGDIEACDAREPLPAWKAWLPLDEDPANR